MFHDYLRCAGCGWEGREFEADENTWTERHEVWGAVQLVEMSEACCPDCGSVHLDPATPDEDPDEFPEAASAAEDERILSEAEEYRLDDPYFDVYEARDAADAFDSGFFEEVA